MHTLSLDAISGLLQTEMVKLINQVNVLNFRGSCLFFLGSVGVNECCVKSVHASETKFNAAKTHFTHIKISFKLLKRFIQVLNDFMY